MRVKDFEATMIFHARKYWLAGNFKQARVMLEAIFAEAGLTPPMIFTDYNSPPSENLNMAFEALFVDVLDVKALSDCYLLLWRWEQYLNREAE